MALTDQAILEIKGMLLRGELGPGDRLPPEKELSEALGLSRNSLREAVKALELIRVLDVRRGDGTYVTSLEPRLLLEAMSFVVDLHQDSSVLELFEARRILEPGAAVLAGRRAKPEDVEGLWTLLDEVDEDTGVEDLVAHDITFHAAIVAMSGNSYLMSILDGLSSRTLRARIWRGLTEQGAVQRTLSEHRTIVDAIASGDDELVRAVVTSHIGGVERWLHTAGDAPHDLETQHVPDRGA
ncbi:GntR family transcriptional repressor for pyruvate dehydrogenase complex [Mumia flava]|uniref:GntR family transcriptional repressor for pyruvate dehydrogenase complex n=1 Tax=Mumia flava TaxID=1348852 RepID=A0A2M9B6X1_9ACTN|nr:FadR/GntR family transcriptional regulator [Mumia flava]PJJ53706.1 GntR family transcriptional repressor for pyruvate dehydrogenase complex [Mumia flava]